MPELKRSYCSAPCIAGGVVACNDNEGGLVGFDAETGRKLWGPLPETTSYTSSPARWVHKGREYFIVAAEKAVCVEPRSGRVLWEAPGAREHGTVALDEDHMICSSGTKRKEDTEGNCGLSAWRITPQGARMIWDLGPGYNNHVCSPVIWEGHVYAFKGQATLCVELATGKIVGEAYFPGVRTCSSVVVADGRVLRENLYRQLYYYDARPGGFRQLGPVWNPTGHAENTTSTMLDGRLLMRGREALFCYDMRRPPPPE
jgi:outer membrane protein assembly factor BamB